MGKDRALTRNTNKTKLVLKHLQEFGSINSLEAIELYGATRLSAIIYNLRKTHIITSVNSLFTDKYGNIGNYAKYVYVAEKA